MTAATKSSKKTKPRKTTRTRNGTVDVLTLAEAAKYLRVSVDDVLHAVEQQALPARRVGSDWRILKSALEEWLRTPMTSRNFWSAQLGALRDDPDLDAFLRDTYRQRGRPMTEEV
jgi:excisionase family DNA binding protein